MSYTTGQQYGLSADNNVIPLAITGTIASIKTPLVANGVWQSEWLPRGQYIGAQTTLYSDVNGFYTIEYSDDNGSTLSMPLVSVQYLATQATRKGAFDVSASYVRFTYTNGTTPQTIFKFEIRFLTAPAQVSIETLNAIGADSRFAQWTKSRIETKDSDAGTYAAIYRTGNSLNVNVTNPSSSAITGTVAISNFPSTQPISGTVTANVTFPSTQNVNITNSSLAINDNSGSITVDGTIAFSNTAIQVSNFPATQPVSLATNTPDITDRVGRLLGHVQIDNSIAISNFPATQPVSGTFYQATQPISASALPLPSGAATSALQTTINTTLTSIVQRASTSTITNVSTTGTSSLVLASNTNRKGCVISCISATTAVLISYGTSNSSTLYSARLITNGYLEVPFGYTGAIYAIGVGNITINELT